MTIKQLESYRANRAELADIDEQLKAQEVSVTVSSAARFPYEKRSVTYPPELPPTSEVQVLLCRKSELETAVREVQSFVDAVSDSELRMTLQLRYIRGKKRPSWQYIAMKLGYCAEHTPKRKLKKFLQMSEMSEKV